MTTITAPIPAAERTQAPFSVRKAEAMLRRATRWAGNGYLNERQREEARVYRRHCYEALLAAEAQR